MKRILIILMLLAPFTLQAQNCNCESNFKWVKQTFEENDAGFAYVLETKGTLAYESHNKLFAKKAKTIKNSLKCGQLINEWLQFFRSGHIGLEILDTGNDSNKKPKKTSRPQKKQTDADIRKQFENWERLDVDIETFKNELLTKQEPGFEGVWESMSAPYKMGVKKEGDNYLGFIIEADGIYWTEGQIKFRIIQEGSQVRSVYYMEDHSPREFDHTMLTGKSYLQMGTITLQRIEPKLEEDVSITQYFRSSKANKPYFDQLNETTSYLRIPSFSHTEKKDIDSVILSNKSKILSSENFIIDIQNNGGGSDASYEELLPILYTNPIREVGAEFYSTPLNNQRMLDLINNPEYNLDEEDKKWAKDSYEKLSKHIGEFVGLDTNVVSTSTLDTIYPYPQNIGIITNKKNGSTSEQFLLAAKQSKKVKLFGTTTFGALDISNMYFVTSPCEEYKLWYCLSKSMRIPDMTIDEKGIQPDYYIDKSVPKYKWIEFVNEVLNSE